MKAIIWTCLLASVCFTYLACNQDNSINKTFNPGEIIELKIGEQAAIKGSNLELTFVDLSEDSRCPSSVVCIWEGRAIVNLQLKINNDLEEIELISRSGHPQIAEKSIGDWDIRLVNVSPYPETQTPIEKEKYIISLVVE